VKVVSKNFALISIIEEANKKLNKIKKENEDYYTKSQDN